ncbi:YtxH domain-containing protein [Parasediminibacterium sp. JCM 36343]|uniref:YtxH domain-containing protein n=1 Tax=Parasediminibacterium sp. JCM 36343 TaxID=3374279 RepID=UPI00397DFA7A
MSTKRIVYTLLAGAAAGAILGILYAPEKGSITRSKISSLGEEDYADIIKDKFNDLLDTVSDKYAVIRSDAEAYLAKIKAKAAEEETSGVEIVVL